MEANTEFINWAKRELGNVLEINKESHGDQSDVYRLRASYGIFFLKISKKLSKERERLIWLQGKLPVPEVKAFITIGDSDALLLTAIQGVNLALLAKEWPPEKVAKRLATVLQVFHAVDPSECLFGKPESGKVLVHGDACLPNFIFEGDMFSGYIDLGDMGVGDKEVDLAAGVWSLQYNLGKGYGALFLEQYGLDNVTEDVVEGLRLRYENMQKEWFPEDYQEDMNT